MNNANKVGDKLSPCLTPLFYINQPLFASSSERIVVVYSSDHGQALQCVYFGKIFITCALCTKLSQTDYTRVAGGLAHASSRQSV